MTRTIASKLRQYVKRIKVEEGITTRWEATANGLRLDHPWPNLDELNAEEYLREVKSSCYPEKVRKIEGDLTRVQEHLSGKQIER